MTAVESRPHPDARRTAARWLYERALAYEHDSRKLGRDSVKGKAAWAVAVELTECARELEVMAVRG